jgi:TPR repeat protein
MLKRISFIFLYLIIGSFSALAMDPPNRKRIRDNSDENCEKPKRRKIEDNYTSQFSNFEIDILVTNDDLIQNALNPEKTNYRHALLYRIYAGLIPVLQISYEDLNSIVSRIRISKKMSDLDIWGWSLLASHRYLAGKVGERKKNIIEATEKLSSILEKKLEESPNNPFYSLCLGLLKLNPAKSQERVSHVRLAAKHGNGFAAFVLAEINNKAILARKKHLGNLEGEKENFLRLASKSGYLYANFILGQEYLNEGDYDAALFYFKRGMKKKQVHCVQIWNDPLYNFPSVNKKSKYNPKALFAKAQALLASKNRLEPEIFHEAEKFLLKSAALGNADAAYALGELYLTHPAASAHDQLSAFETIKQAAKVGHMKALSFMGFKAFGNLDFDTCLSWYKKWLSNPHHDDEADVFFHGPDIAQVLADYKNALNLDPVACKNFALFILRNINRFEKSPLDLAEKLLISAYENNNCLESAYQLGCIYNDPKSPHYNSERAQYLLREAAKKPELYKNAHAQLTWMAFLQGEIEEALRLIAQADLETFKNNPVVAKLEEIVALSGAEKFYQLGAIFVGGIIKSQVLGDYQEDLVFINLLTSPLKSIELWEMALELSLLEPPMFEKYADKLLHQLFEFYTKPDSQNPEMAKVLLEKLAKLDNAPACMLLARSYAGQQFNNLSITELDHLLAFGYLKQAADKLYPEALMLMFKFYVSGSEKFNIQINNFEALKYGTLWYEKLSAELQIQHKMLYRKSILKLCTFSFLPTKKDTLLTDEQCNILDSFIGEDDGPLENLSNLYDAFTFLSGLFTSHKLKETFCDTKNHFGATRCQHIANLTQDLSALLKTINKNITRPGFLITMMNPRTTEILDKLKDNPELFPISKTSLLFKDEINPLIESINMLISLLGDLNQKNVFILNLLEKFGDDERTIKTLLEGLSMMPDINTYDYAQSILTTVFSNEHPDWPKNERLTWAKKQLKDMQEYCSKEIVSFLKDLSDKIILLIKDTEDYRNTVFYNQNNFLFQ